MKWLDVMKKLSIKNKIFVTIIFVLFGIITSCTPKIKTDFYENTIHINKGDSAKLYWNFYNAKGVQIQGRYRIFNPQDSTFVFPDTTTTYKVTAFDKGKDDLTINWNVIIDTDVNARRSFGINDISGMPLGSISVIGTDSLGSNQYRFNFLALNPTDNFIIDAEFKKSNFEIKIPTRTGAKVRIDSVGIFAAPDYMTNEICFCIDNSDANIYRKQIFEAIEYASEYFHSNDNFYVSLFNHNWLGALEVSRDWDGKPDFRNVFNSTPPPSGFCAINTSVAITINYLTQTLNKNLNTIILITSSADNASILYDENELLEHAKKNGIKIYVLAIGHSTPTYNLSKLAAGTGGKLFLVDEYDLDIIIHYVNKILFSKRHHYFVDVNFYKPDNIANVDFNLNLIGQSNRSLNDNISILLKKEKLFSDYQIVAGFENNEIFINPIYDNLIDRLSQALKNNPHLTIELIGNSGAMEGSEQTCKNFALQRSQIVRKRLINEGVNQEQIRITNNSSETPIYMFPTAEWQHKYNNRVEVKWLIVENYPYEIISDKLIFSSEEKAMEEIESLELKGYRAYYQRIIRNQRPAYRIIIWGYQTEKEANIALEEINKKLKLQCYVRQVKFIEK